MKRYLLFEGEEREEKGGAWDLSGSYDELIQAIDIADTSTRRWVNVYDTLSGKIVYEYFRGEHKLIVP